MHGLRTQCTARTLGSAIAVATAFFVLCAATSASARGVNNLMAGINGLATFPFDPIASAVEPPDAFEDMAGAPVTPMIFGFFQGTLLGMYRLAMGTLDIVFFPFWIFPTLSPEARYDLFNDYDVEYE
jgi:hypothetical protein